MPVAPRARPAIASIPRSRGFPQLGEGLAIENFRKTAQRSSVRRIFLPASQQI
jgi:hypothetical protein